MNIYPHWELSSIIFYVILGYIGAIAIKTGSKKQFPLIRIYGTSVSANFPYLLWWIIWTFTATFRLINTHGIGGTDAWSYKNYFGIANGNISGVDDLIIEFSEHYEILFKFVTRIVRFFTDDYHIFFFLLYGFIVLSFQKTIKSFQFDRIYAAPFICIFFVYLRSFNTLRTELSVGFILLMVISLKKDDYRKAVLFSIMAVGMQISSALYVLFIPFHFYYRKGKLKISRIVFLILLSVFVGMFSQKVLTGSVGMSLGHMYYSYAAHNIGKSFLENYWKIAFGQIMIGILILIFDKKLRKRLDPESDISKSIYYAREVCLFDVVTIPITFILDIWRAYEYLYIIRLIMWAYITYMYLKDKGVVYRRLICFAEIVGFTGWLVFRINHTWEQSGYLPLIFSFLE